MFLAKQTHLKCTVRCVDELKSIEPKQTGEGRQVGGEWGTSLIRLTVQPLTTPVSFSSEICEGSKPLDSLSRRTPLYSGHSTSSIVARLPTLRCSVTVTVARTPAQQSN